MREASGRGRGARGFSRVWSYVAEVCKWDGAGRTRRRQWNARSAAFARGRPPGRSACRLPRSARPAARAGLTGAAARSFAAAGTLARSGGALPRSAGGLARSGTRSTCRLARSAAGPPRRRPARAAATAGRRALAFHHRVLVRPHAAAARACHVVHLGVVVSACHAVDPSFGGARSQHSCLVNHHCEHFVRTGRITKEFVPQEAR
jgi:hypothetical protein